MRGVAVLIAALAWELSQAGAAPALARGLPQAGTAPEHEHPRPTVLAPGYADLEFTPPPAGSYLLPPLGGAADGEVLDSLGVPHNVHDLLGDKIVVLSFIFTTCSDINGCPLATHVLKGVQDRLMESADLSNNVRLISFSFDPTHDTPEVLQDYARHFRNAEFDWRFVTCRSEEALAPILSEFGQSVIKDYDLQGNAIGTMSHVLRVYLIDRQKRIRNIYSTSFLHADTLANDIRTLALESG